MLEGGADIRFIQQMLGHAELSTTQIYTQVSLRELAAIHAATHPGATNARHSSPAETDDKEVTDAAGELLEALDQEAAEEAAAPRACGDEGSKPAPARATLEPR